MRVDLLDDARVDAVVVTPAHQSPMGAVLAPDRRAALLGWVQRTGGLIVEDDYDAEYRYDREPVGALQGLDPDHVLYAGSASKILAPALRLGWLVAPPALSRALVEHKAHADLGTPLSSSSPSRTSSRAASSSAICGARAAATAPAATRCCKRSPATSRACRPRVSRPGCTPSCSCPGHRRARAGRGGRCARHRDPRPRSAALRPALRAPGLILGYAAMPEPAIAAAIAELAELMPR